MRSNFSSYPQYFCYLMLDFCVKTRISFSIRDKPLFEITEVEITRVDCIYLFAYLFILLCNIACRIYSYTMHRLL